jgi:N-acylneuraminate cytidylyltransferase
VINNYKIFVPVRSGSERVINKNTRVFANEPFGLLGLKLKELVILGYPIVVSSDDELVEKIVADINHPLINFDSRPRDLCSSTTPVIELIKYVGELFDIEDTVIWTHVTSPFVKSEVYVDAINMFESNEDCDSLMTVTKLQQFIWDEEMSDFINNPKGKDKWPRTQDLKPLYEINHAFYINSVDNIRKLEDRIGIRPVLFELDKLQSFDIDWESDFKIAESIYESLKLL